MTFTTALSQIPGEMQIRRALEKIVFGKKVWCPTCGRQRYVTPIEPHKRWRCRACRSKFSVTSITWLKGIKVPLRSLWCLIWCWQKKLPIQQTRDLLGLSIPTIRRYYALFRDHLELDFDIQLAGNVQMDEMFVKGGFVVGAKDIQRKRIKLTVVPRPYPTKQDANRFLFQYVKPGSTLCTDGGGIYKGCELWWPVTHQYEIHRKFEFEITSQIEGTWANLRTFMRRMYHHVTFKKLPNVVAEFEARYSNPELFVSPLAFLKNSLCAVPLAF